MFQINVQAVDFWQMALNDFVFNKDFKKSHLAGKVPNEIFVSPKSINASQILCGLM